MPDKIGFKLQPRVPVCGLVPPCFVRLGVSSTTLWVKSSHLCFPHPRCLRFTRWWVGSLGLARMALTALRHQAPFHTEIRLASRPASSRPTSPANRRHKSAVAPGQSGPLAAAHRRAPGLVVRRAYSGHSSPAQSSTCRRPSISRHTSIMSPELSLSQVGFNSTYIYSRIQLNSMGETKTSRTKANSWMGRFCVSSRVHER